MSRKPATKASVLQLPDQRNDRDPQPPQGAGVVVPKRITGLLPITREKIGFAFLRGSKMRTLRVSYELPMSALEEVIREEMVARLNRRAA